MGLVDLQVLKVSLNCNCIQMTQKQTGTVSILFVSQSFIHEIQLTNVTIIGLVRLQFYNHINTSIGLRACCLERSVVIDRIPGVKTAIPGAINYPIQKKKGLPFGMSILKMFYSESLIDKLLAIVGMIRHG